MTHDTSTTFTRRALRLAGLGLLVAGVVALGLLGWRWRSSATVERVAVTGTQHAPPDTVRRLARVDSGAAMTAVAPTLVVDRVVRHPWIEDAQVTQHWTYGTLTISVRERTPAALAVDDQGRPAYYLDRAGHALPLPDSAGYDVPLVRGLDTETPWTRPDSAQSPPVVHRVLAALPETKAADLVAEIEVKPDRSVRLATTPVGKHDPMSVRLGSGDVGRKLRTLHAFVRQVLAAKSDVTIDEIDLRFDGQVVTRTQSLDG